MSNEGVVKEVTKPVYVPRKASTVSWTSLVASAIIGIWTVVSPFLNDTQRAKGDAAVAWVKENQPKIQALEDALRNLQEKNAASESKLQTLTVENAATVAKLQSLEAKPPAPIEVKRELTPDEILNLINQWKPLIPVIKVIIDDLFPKPKPTPPIVVPPPITPPVVVPPIQPPNPTPTPTALRLRLLNPHGLEIPSGIVDAGALILVRLADPSIPVSWHASSSIGEVPSLSVANEDMRVQGAKLADGFALVLASGQYVDVTATNAKLEKVSMRITANQGAQPPPVVNPPNPQPVQKRLLSITAVVDPDHVTNAIAAVVNNLGMIHELEASGHTWEAITPTQTKAWMVTPLQGVKLPVLILQDKSTKEVIKVVPLPTKDAFRSVIVESGG